MPCTVHIESLQNGALDAQRWPKSICSMNLIPTRALKFVPIERNWFLKVKGKKRKVLDDQPFLPVVIFCPQYVTAETAVQSPA